MGGDVGHHIGLLRPSSLAPLPPSIVETLPQKLKNIRANQPLLVPSKWAHDDLDQSNTSLEAVLRLDAREDVLTVLAHDASIHPVLDQASLMYPAAVDHWRDRGLKQETSWAFLQEENPGYLWGVSA
jgi:hypothetical protein